MALQNLSVVRALCAVLLCAGAAGGCSAPDSGLEADLASRRDPIYGGTLDTTHDAVVALVRFGRTTIGSCSATIIAKQAGSGILLTAAHCVLEIDANEQVIVPIKVVSPASLIVLPGADYQTAFNSAKAYYVAEITVHPQYDGNTQNPYDLALVRYVGATDATPTIAPLSLAEDKLAVASPFTLVGFGRTETNSNNSQRRKVDKVVASLNARQISYDQRDGKGSCQGDSGGPALVQTPGGERIAGVTSYGDFDCLTEGVSVRVSADSTFIQNVLSSIPKALTCDECRTGSIGPDDKCFAAWQPCTIDGSPCSRFLECANNCQSSACYDACVSNNPAGAKVRDALAECQCSTACATECAHDSSCGKPSCGGLTVPGALCTSCIQQSCCTEAEACGTDTACAACFGQAGPQCMTNPLYNGLIGCLGRCSANPCKIAGAAGPAVDAGATPVGGASDAAPPNPPASDAAVMVQYQAVSTPAVAAQSGGCSCRQARSDRGDLGRFLAASCVALVVAHGRSRGRAQRRRLHSVR